MEKFVIVVIVGSDADAAIPGTAQGSQKGAKVSDK